MNKVTASPKIPAWRWNGIAEQRNKISFPPSEVSADSICPVKICQTNRTKHSSISLVLLTKGQQDEQSAKIERSGLLPHFHAVRVVREKAPPIYTAACGEFGASPGRCWMVGNSPRSDVNPARQAGLRTVLVPHAAPWHRERVPRVEEGPETLVVRSFADVPGLLSRR